MAMCAACFADVEAQERCPACGGSATGVPPGEASTLSLAERIDMFHAVPDIAPMPGWMRVLLVAGASAVLGAALVVLGRGA